MEDSPYRGSMSDTFPLSPSQLSLLVAQQLRPEVPVTIAQYVDVDGPLDIAVLTAASKQTGREIGSGYLRLVEVDGTPRQWLDVDMDDHLDVVDLRGEPDPEAAAQDWMHREHTTPMDPFVDRLVRMAVLLLRDNRYYWYSRIHHVALDGFGAMSMMNRTAEIYTASVRTNRFPTRRRRRSPLWSSPNPTIWIQRDGTAIVSTGTRRWLISQPGRPWHRRRPRPSRGPESGRRLCLWRCETHSQLSRTLMMRQPRQSSSEPWRHTWLARSAPVTWS